MCINSLETCLQEYESIYRASQAVAQFPTMPRVVSRRKRGDEDSEDDEPQDRYVLPYQRWKRS